MRKCFARWIPGLAAPLLLACGSSAEAPAASEGLGGQEAGIDGPAPSDGGAPQDAGSGIETGVDAGGPADAVGSDAPASTTNIRHVVLIVQENHSFDSYFGHWCTAPAGSNPSCTKGPACCESAPATEPTGSAPVALDDTENAAYDPNHTQSCELSEIDNGKMDGFVKGTSCSDARNFAVAPLTSVPQYATWAGQYAIADRWFQPIVGQSSSNDMYLAVAQYVFTDNSYQPDSNGKGCTLPPTATKQYAGQTTIADLLLAGGKSFAAYAEGYAAMVSSAVCPAPPSDCTMTPFPLPTAPCDYSPGDIPFEFYSQFTDVPAYMKDLADLTKDVQGGTLPSFSYVKRVQYKNEHPGYGTTIANGQAAVKEIVDLILGSGYADDTLVLLTWDEGGGLFDHVAPPVTSTVDHQPYGTRVPTLAIGRFARAGTVSHVVLEHSSVVKFLELNFLGTTGQLHARDAVVANIGSLLDPAQTGIVVPEN